MSMNYSKLIVPLKKTRISEGAHSFRLSPEYMSVAGSKEDPEDIFARLKR
jgi:hypothetical protein